MTQIRLTNINSPVNRALYAFKTYEEAAKATNVEVSTVMQWRASDRVPTEHLLTLSQKANMNVFELLNSGALSAQPASTIKPSSQSA